jgi:hypothetical protein
MCAEKAKPKTRKPRRGCQRCNWTGWIIVTPDPNFVVRRCICSGGPEPANSRRRQTVGGERCSLKTLREMVRESMVHIHRISPELADYHISHMTDNELQERLKRYSRLGMELSAAGPKLSAGNVSSTRFSRPATMTAGRAALNPVFGRKTREQSCQIRR